MVFDMAASTLSWKAACILTCISGEISDEVTKTLPDGVYLTTLKQDDSKAGIRGIAQSNARVSNFMRNIETSEWLENPRLNIIETNIEEGKRTSYFSLSVQQKKNSRETEKE